MLVPKSYNGHLASPVTFENSDRSRFFFFFFFLQPQFKEGKGCASSHGLLRAGLGDEVCWRMGVHLISMLSLTLLLGILHNDLKVVVFVFY